MKIESIDQEPLEGTEIILTQVVMSAVSNQCILIRLMIDALGRPGVDSDLEVFASGDRWIVTWTRPELTLNETRALISRTIQPLNQGLSSSF